MIFEVFYIIAAILALLSVGFNVFLIWYCRGLLGRLLYVSDNMTTLVEEVVYFHEHLSSVHELEVFYGDETLGNLIRHSNGLIETLEDFEEIYTLFEEGSEELFEEAQAELPDSPWGGSN